MELIDIREAIEIYLGAELSLVWGGAFWDEKRGLGARIGNELVDVYEAARIPTGAILWEVRNGIGP